MNHVFGQVFAPKLDLVDSVDVAALWPRAPVVLVDLGANAERGEERRRPVDHLVIVGVAIDFGELAAQAEPERRVECWIHGDGVLSF